MNFYLLEFIQLIDIVCNKFEQIQIGIKNITMSADDTDIFSWFQFFKNQGYDEAVSFFVDYLSKSLMFLKISFP